MFAAHQKFMILPTTYYGILQYMVYHKLQILWYTARNFVAYAIPYTIRFVTFGMTYTISDNTSVLAVHVSNDWLGKDGGRESGLHS